MLIVAGVTMAFLSFMDSSVVHLDSAWSLSNEKLGHEQHPDNLASMVCKGLLSGVKGGAQPPFFGRRLEKSVLRKRLLGGIGVQAWHSPHFCPLTCSPSKMLRELEQEDQL
mmetsp:Transcript_4871/g.7590  ORF Transcript_4871/g.7590 Transcript_4871/m.7590 type:complete len:111 (-) Transcript_4871:334-666(-)